MLRKGASNRTVGQGASALPARIVLDVAADVGARIVSGRLQNLSEVVDAIELTPPPILRIGLHQCFRADRKRQSLRKCVRSEPCLPAGFVVSSRHASHRRCTARQQRTQAKLQPLSVDMVDDNGQPVRKFGWVWNLWAHTTF